MPRKTILFLQEGRFSRSRSSKVINVGANRKRVCDFLLVRHCILGPILYRTVSEILHVFMLLTPPLFYPNFGGVSVAPDRPCWGEQAHRPRAIWLWKYFRRIPTYVITVPKRHGRTDRQTTCNLITALCVASRGKTEGNTKLTAVTAGVGKSPSEGEFASVDRFVRCEDNQDGWTGGRNCWWCGSSAVLAWTDSRRWCCRTVVECNVVPTMAKISFKLHFVHCYRYRLRHCITHC